MKPLALAFLLVLAPSLSAQEPARSPLALADEPAVPRGMVAVRVINHTDCQLAIRVRRDGVTKGTAPVPAHDGLALHTRPDTSAVEVEVVADPRLCAAPSPAAPAPAARMLTGHRPQSLQGANAWSRRCFSSEQYHTRLMRRRSQSWACQSQVSGLSERIRAYYTSAQFAV